MCRGMGQSFVEQEDSFWVPGQPRCREAAGGDPRPGQAGKDTTKAKGTVVRRAGGAEWCGCCESFLHLQGSLWKFQFRRKKRKRALSAGGVGGTEKSRLAPKMIMRAPDSDETFKESQRFSSAESIVPGDVVTLRPFSFPSLLKAVFANFFNSFGFAVHLWDLSFLPGVEPTPLCWKFGVLTTGLPGGPPFLKWN